MLPFMKLLPLVAFTDESSGDTACSTEPGESVFDPVCIASTITVPKAAATTIVINAKTLILPSMVFDFTSYRQKDCQS
jgi:hypothetical protein